MVSICEAQRPSFLRMVCTCMSTVRGPPSYSAPQTSSSSRSRSKAFSGCSIR